MEITVHPGIASARVKVPSSKSHSIRALLIASLAEGESTIRNLLSSEDTSACVRACRALGAIVELGANGEARVRGTGGRLKTPGDVIDVANSGTTLYLLLAAACLSQGQTVFTGDEQIRRRSAANLIAALADLGARAESTRGNGCAPFVCQGPLRGGQTAIECPTSQYLSALLLATPLAEEDTTIEVPLLNEKPYVDITLSWLDAQQIRYEREGYGRFKIQGGQSYRAFDRALSGDYSSAGFLFCAAAVGKAPVTVSGLDPRDPQGDKGMLGILERMGCRIEWRGAEVTVYPPASADGLRGGTFDLNAMPDALPALAVTAAFARAEVRLTNVPQAREKETDRIAVMASLLSELGVDCEELPDGLVIRGRGRLGGGRVHGHGDHRVVMSLAVGALGAVEPLTIEGAEAAGVTFPGFFDALEQLRSA